MRVKIEIGNYGVQIHNLGKTPAYVRYAFANGRRLDPERILSLRLDQPDAIEVTDEPPLPTSNPESGAQTLPPEPK